VGEARQEFEPQNPKSLALRTHSQTSGWSLTAQDVFNNVTRTCIEAMAATQGHTQSLHTNALDEALALPTDFSARIARNTQLFLQQEAAPAGSSIRGAARIYVERLTADLAAKAWAHIQEVEALGGMAKAIEKGMPKLRIEEAAARTQARIDSGDQTVVGVNKYRLRRGDEIDILKVDNASVRRQQLDKLQRLRPSADQPQVDAARRADEDRRDRQWKPAGRSPWRRHAPRRRWARFQPRSRRSGAGTVARTQIIKGVYKREAGMNSEAIARPGARWTPSRGRWPGTEDPRRQDGPGRP
jgi:methylmalonyl-CoA mutase